MSRVNRHATAAAILALCLTGQAIAAEKPHHDMSAPGMDHGAAAASDTPATKAYRAASDRMHKDMTVPYTNDADTDFARGMIPHHRAAIDMAKIVLKYGKDPEIRKLAESVVAAQEQEIAVMKAWLAKRQK